jgi:2-C-methyl-D-erythritol 2,4-cyclodiphosphate synthase
MARIGLGYDSHRFVPGGGPVRLGGVDVEHDRHLAGHSDGDAVLHAITDAILGALAAGDIGELFPDTDERWADADSAVFVARAVEIAAEHRCRVANCDVTIVTEAPKIAPRRDAMRERIAALLGVDAGAVSVKAKTNEQMGALGRGEGLLALAAVCLDESA